MQRAKLWLWLHAIGVCLLTQDHVFFWDTVQLSAKQAYWFYNNGLGSFLLPPDLDSGHPPLMGWYLALCWVVFGKSLMVSHWAMFPVILAINYGLYRVIRLLHPTKDWSVWLMLIFWFDPVLAGQLALVSPDLLLVAGFLTALLGILKSQRAYLIGGILLLSLISMRGMMTALALFVYDWSLGARFRPKEGFRKLLSYLPGFAGALIFLAWHYLRKGWIGYHPDSPWAPSFELIVDPGMFIRNTVILTWRLLDFGRIFFWLALFWLIWQKRKRPDLLKLFALPLILALVFFPVMVLYAHLSAHRYLLPFFLALSLSSLQLLQGSLDLAVAKKIKILIIIGLVTGNCWVYPATVAQGWDSTLAHIPYYRNSKVVLDFMEAQGIAPDSTGTAFPEIGPRKYRDLSDEDAGMVGKNLSGQSLVFYSNVMNDFSDAELEELQANWIPVKTSGKWPVRVILYEKKNLCEN